MSTLEELNAQKAELLDRIFERAGNDLVFRSLLINNPGVALQQAGFADDIRKLSSVDDVSGYVFSVGAPQLSAMVDPPMKHQTAIVGSVISGVESLFSWATAMVAELAPAPNSGEPPTLDYMPNRRAV